MSDDTPLPTGTFQYVEAMVPTSTPTEPAGLSTRTGGELDVAIDVDVRPGADPIISITTDGVSVAELDPRTAWALGTLLLGAAIRADYR